MEEKSGIVFGENEKNNIKDGVNKPSEQVINVGLFYFKTFLIMAFGLLITGLVSIGVSYLLLNLFPIYAGESIVAYTVATIVSSILLVITSLIVSFRKEKLGAFAIIPFLIYTVSMGILLSSFLIFVQEPTFLGILFILTAVLFVIMGITGFLFKGKGLSIFIGIVFCVGLGMLFFFLINTFLLPIILVTMSEAFLQSYMYIIYIVEALFLVLILSYTAIDMGRLKRSANAGNTSTGNSIYFALILFSDFITIFIYLIRLLGIISLKKK